MMRRNLSTSTPFALKKEVKRRVDCTENQGMILFGTNKYQTQQKGKQVLFATLVIYPLLSAMPKT